MPKVTDDGYLDFQNNWTDAGNWLDRVSPGWFNRVDEMALSGDYHNKGHILNQVFNNIHKGLWYANGYFMAANVYKLSLIGSDRVWSDKANNWRYQVIQRKNAPMNYAFYGHLSNIGNNVKGKLWDDSRLDLTIHADGTVTGRLK